jgi:hypothetical protein
MRRNNMLFDKQWLLDNVVDGEPVENNIVDHTRWSVIHECIFENAGKYYRTTYSVGATEVQDEEPYGYEPDKIECQEVVKEEYTATRWVPC